MLYDVFVVGSKDPSAVAQMHVAAALAKHFQAPVADVAQAIASRNLRAGKAMDEAQARVLSQQLAGLGAETELRPSVGASRQRVPTQTNVRAATTAEIAVSSLPTLANIPGTDPVGRDPFSTAHPHPQSVTSGTYAAVPTLGSLSPQTGTATAVRPPAATRAGSSGARNPFASPDETMPKLELARPTASSRAAVETAEVPKVRAPGGGTDHMRFGPADSTVSGVEVAGRDHHDGSHGQHGDGKAHTVRCAKHGLYYDARASSGCRKCLEPAKQVARKLERSALGFRLMALRDNPAKRAGWGLTLALALGFIPAAWHALAFGRPAVRALRAEQAVLSQKVGTEEVIKRYHGLDQRVQEEHARHRRNTALVWVVLAGGALAGWYRVT